MIERLKARGFHTISIEGGIHESSKCYQDTGGDGNRRSFGAHGVFKRNDHFHHGFYGGVDYFDYLNQSDDYHVQTADHLDSFDFCFDYYDGQAHNHFGFHNFDNGDLYSKANDHDSRFLRHVSHGPE
jgi:hypothetical protein